MTVSPSACVISAMYCAWRSVGKPGKVQVDMSMGLMRVRGRRPTWNHPAPVWTCAPASSSLSSKTFRSSGRLHSIRSSPPAAATAIAYVHDSALSTDALDARAHLSKQEAQVLDVRLASGVEDLGSTFREHCGEQDVLGAGHGRQVEHDALPAQPVDLSDDLGGGLLDAGTHLSQPAQVLFDAPGPDVIPARPGQTRLAVPSQKGTQKHDRRAHAPPELIGHIGPPCVPHPQDDRALPLRASAQ